MAYVYRYIDKEDEIVKYIGIVYKSNLSKRLTAHRSKDDWKNKGNWRIEYFECENRSVAEAFESHLIALYGTDKYYNKAKKGWGINKYLPDVEQRWKVMQDSRYESKEVCFVVFHIKELIRQGKREEAAELLEYIDIIK